MKQIQLDQFDPARLLTYLLSRLIESHAVDQAPKQKQFGQDWYRPRPVVVRAPQNR
jgi:hypothetical protein